MTEPIFHIALESDWVAARATGAYRISTIGRTLEEEGFIHASREDQWETTLERFYGEVRDSLLLLVIDPARLTSPVRVEQVGDDSFPHVFGPINRDAVMEVRTLRAADPADPGHAPAPGRRRQVALLAVVLLALVTAVLVIAVGQ